MCHSETPGLCLSSDISIQVATDCPCWSLYKLTTPIRDIYDSPHYLANSPTLFERWYGKWPTLMFSQQYQHVIKGKDYKSQSNGHLRVNALFFQIILSTNSLGKCMEVSLRNLYGEGVWGALWNFKAAVFSVLGAKLRTRECVFHSRKCSFYASFDLSVTQSIPTSNEQMMKLKLRTFGRKEILRKPIKKLVKNWLKCSVHIIKAQRITIGLLWNHS